MMCILRVPDPSTHFCIVQGQNIKELVNASNYTLMLCCRSQSLSVQVAVDGPGLGLFNDIMSRLQKLVTPADSSSRPCGNRTTPCTPSVKSSAICSPFSVHDCVGFLI